MPTSARLSERYELRGILDRGGMGVVYRAYDTVIRREVALKTIRETPTQAALQLFYKECDALTRISHPNIVEIFDLGEFEIEGKSYPCFVMPLLPGATLHRLLRDSPHRLTVERAVDIMLQACRGLQAAHEHSLVHRDIKPSNLFVMPDDSVKIIDFGVAHMVDVRSSTDPKGTLLYMAPEILQRKPPSPLSDMFSLAVVCYEVLTRRRPFDRPAEGEVIDAILHHIPPPASDLNPAVSQTLSRVIHKGLAKPPWHRFSSAREFGDCLNKGLHNQPIEFFAPARIQPRIQRAQAAFEQGDHEFAAEVLGELEAEGHIDPAMSQLRQQINRAVRQKTVAQLLEAARTRIQNEEYHLALQKIQEVLELDPANAPALGLRTTIQNRLTVQKIDDWIRLAQQHLNNRAYSHAREALEKVLQLRSHESRAEQLLAEVDRQEQEYLRVQRQKQQLFRSAQEAWQDGEVSSALSKIEKVLELDRLAPDTSPERAASYHSLFNQVRTEHDAIQQSYAEARKCLSDRNFQRALDLCQGVLARRPGHALFQALLYETEERQRQDLSARIVEVDRQVEAEPDLDRRVSILEQAVAAYPGEAHFQKALRLTQDRRDLVNSLVAKAQMHEERGQFSEALAQLEILGSIYDQYPGLQFEKQRLIERREQQARAEAKAVWVDRVNRLLESGNPHGALKALQEAQAEFPGDPELAARERLAQERLESAAEAQRLLAEGQELGAQQRLEEALNALRRAHQLDRANLAARGALLGALVQQAKLLAGQDWHAAEPLVQEALELDPNDLAVKSLQVLLVDHKRAEEVRQCITQVRQFRAAGDLRSALALTDQVLATHARDPWLVQLREVLVRELREAERQATVRADLDELLRLAQELDLGGAAAPILEKARTLLARHPGHAEMQQAFEALERKVAAPQGEMRAAAAVGGAPVQVTPPKPPPQAGHPPAAAPVAPPPEPAIQPTPTPQPMPTPPPVRGWIAKLVEAAMRIRPAWWIAAAAAGLVLIAVMLFLLLRRPETAIVKTPGEATAGAAALADISLAPLPQTLRIVSNLSAAQVTLDDQPAQDLEGRQLTLENVPAGKHTLKVASRSGEAIFEFQIVPGSAPTLTSPISARQWTALAVCGTAERARIYASAGMRISMDGQDIGEAGPLGLDLPPTKPGPHKLSVGERGRSRTFSIELGSAPTLTLILRAERRTGTLLVLTGEADVTVFLDGNPCGQTTEEGQLRIELEPGERRVRVAKEGFLQAPEQVVQISEGEVAKVPFTLRPIPKPAIFVIHGAPPGAEISLDGKLLGTVGEDGTFRSTEVAPGKHVIEARLKGHRPKIVERDFAAGESFTFEKGEFKLRPLYGKLELTVSPPGAEVTLTRAGEKQQRPVKPPTVELEEGSYTITARAPLCVDRSEPVNIKGGATSSLNLALSCGPAPQPVASNPMDGWDSLWEPDGDWFVQRGPRLILYRGMARGGTYTFTAKLITGRVARMRGKPLEWVIVDFRGDSEQLIFRINKTWFRRVVIRAGRATTQQMNHGLSLNDHIEVRLQVRVAPSGVTHEVWKEGRWVVLDDYRSEKGHDPTLGRLGFRIQGNDEVRLHKDFSFVPAN